MPKQRPRKALIRKIGKHNPGVNEKQLREALEALRILRYRCKGRRKRYSLDSPFAPVRRKEPIDDPRAVYL